VTETGRRFEFPDGSLYEIVVPASTTAGARTELRVILPPTPIAPPPHIHPTQTETHTVESGAFDVLVGRDWRTITAGQTVTVPSGTVHTFRNRSGENVELRSVYSPSLECERYLERLYWLFAMNRIQRSRSLSSRLYSALLWDTHRADQVLASRMAQTAIGTLARVARLLGFRVDR
jgi:mannose-6-phosphate isomerase-like protein (cupin superfamily)